MNISHMNKEKLLILSLSGVLFLAVSFIVYSWSEPTTTMPSGYTEPINTSTNAQKKFGEIAASMFRDAEKQNYYIDAGGVQSVLAGDLLIDGKIQAGGEILDTDSSSTVVTKGYVGKMFNVNKGSQVLYLVGKNISCPDGYVSLERRWSARTCVNYSSCTTDENWYKDAPSCTFVAMGGGNCDRGLEECTSYAFSTGCCYNSTCTAHEWDEIMCIGMTRGDDEYLATAKHKVSECTGEVVTTNDGYKICRYDSATCPSGWYQFYNWSTTQATESQPYGENNTTCATSFHTWSNTPVEACSGPIYSYSSSYFGASVHQYLTCYATITQIGCI
ncbi:MAG: hypothetical protein PHY30_00640 [Candidatus Pacebacteria bacterium]|nr:hypothetical protein [Candidatus Paceibacterota bacterium]